MGLIEGVEDRVAGVYRLSRVVEDGEGEDAEKVQTKDVDHGEEELALDDGEFLLWDDGCHIAVFHNDHFWLCGGRLGGFGGSYFRLRWPPALYPEGNCHDGEVDGH